MNNFIRGDVFVMSPISTYFKLILIFGIGFIFGTISIVAYITGRLKEAGYKVEIEIDIARWDYHVAVKKDDEGANDGDQTHP
jgi:hypothetical protein